MSLNSFGHLFRVATWGESHGPALGATVDGCPPGVAIDADTLQHWLDLRKPGQNKYTTQRREADEVAGDGTLLPRILDANPGKTVVRRELLGKIQSLLADPIRNIIYVWNPIAQ